MNNQNIEQVIDLFQQLTQRYRTKRNRLDARILFHLELDKIQSNGHLPQQTFRFINEAQTDFCYEYTRLRNIFNRPIIRKFTMHQVKSYFSNKLFLMNDPLRTTYSKTLIKTPFLDIHKGQERSKAPDISRSI